MSDLGTKCEDVFSPFKGNSKGLSGICIIVCIRWILWLSVRYAAAHREIFDTNIFSGKLHQLVSPNLQDIFFGR